MYTTLAQKVKETEISAQDTSGRVRLASSAVAPDWPMSKNLLKNTAIALMLGLVVAIMGVLALEYFQEPAKVSTDPRPERNPTVEIA